MESKPLRYLQLDTAWQIARSLEMVGRLADASIDTHFGSSFPDGWWKQDEEAKSVEDATADRIDILTHAEQRELLAVFLVGRDSMDFVSAMSQADDAADAFIGRKIARAADSGEHIRCGLRALGYPTDGPK